MAYGAFTIKIDLNTIFRETLTTIFQLISWITWNTAKHWRISAVSNWRNAFIAY